MLLVGGSRITNQDLLTSELIVDGKKVPINQFVQNVLAGIIGGVLDYIHSVDYDWKVVEITIKRNE
jgi:hypothetical protein